MLGGLGSTVAASHGGDARRASIQPGSLQPTPGEARGRPSDAAELRLQSLIANITRADAAAVVALTQPFADGAREGYGAVAAAYAADGADGPDAPSGGGRSLTI